MGKSFFGANPDLTLKNFYKEVQGATEQYIKN
jgi:hypothetical protein